MRVATEERGVDSESGYRGERSGQWRQRREEWTVRVATEERGVDSDSGDRGERSGQ